MTLILILTNLTFSKRVSRQDKTCDNELQQFSDTQNKYLEEIQSLAQKGGLPESDWKAITEYDNEVCYDMDCLESGTFYFNL